MNIQRLSVIASLSAMIAACGGGGGSSNGGTTSPPAGVPAGTTQTTPTYPTGSVQSTILRLVNSNRTQCGFPALSQNTILDAAAEAHTDYQVANGFAITDEEVIGKAGFTGVTANDRAIAKGWPSGLYAATQNAGVINDNLTTDSQYGEGTFQAWETGVYHQTAVTWLANVVGIGNSSSMYSGSRVEISGLVFSSDGSGTDKISPSQLPATFPCAGVTGIPAYGAGETPLPPVFETWHTVSGDIQRWGTPVTVEGNASDVVQLSTGTYTAPDGTVIQLNRVTAANDPNKLTPANKVVAYPTNALTSNTTYTVDLAGTINGVAFTKHFTFTTGN